MTTEIPGFKQLDITDIVCDYNGTIAKDGMVLPSVLELFERLAKVYRVHVITADTFGTVAKQLEKSEVTLKILSSNDHTEEKAQYLQSIGAQRCVAIGNGSNDMSMLKSAALGIAVIGDEGCATATLMSADVCCTNIEDALELLLHPKRLVATLRR